MDYFYWWRALLKSWSWLNLGESFTLAQTSKKRCQIKTLKNIYLHKKKMLQVVIWQLFFKIWATAKKLSEIKLSLPNILSESHIYCVHSRESFMHLNIITFNSKFPRKLHTCKIAQKLFSFAVQFYLSFGKILGKISHKRTS